MMGKVPSGESSFRRRITSISMTDYREGIKRRVAETKFLIHDLRVEPFINEVIHFHVTLDTDLEIYGIDQAQVLHGEDLEVLKRLGSQVRRAFQEYSNAVRSFSPEKTILAAGQKYIETVHAIGDLILNPHWGRIDSVLEFLPEDSRSVIGRNHYKNCLRWIAGVHRRIAHFIEEQNGTADADRPFDVGAEIREYTMNVVRGYVAEKSRAKVELQLGQLDPAVVVGNVPRFRRMYFNLIMNAVDAMVNRRVGIIRINAIVNGDRVTLEVTDDGGGMSDAKAAALLTEKETLDGELHSIGFVFVRQTVADFRGELSIVSALDKGTTVSISLPCRNDSVAAPRYPSGFERFGPLLDEVADARKRTTAIALMREQSAAVREQAAAVKAESARAESGRAKEPMAAGGERAASVDANVASGAAETVTAAAADTADSTAKSAVADAEKTAPAEPEAMCGKIVHEDFQSSQAQHPGCIFAIAVNEDDCVEFFTHKPYERYWNISHEDLSPMLFQAVVRGRLEEDEGKEPVLILKPPSDMLEYFEFKEIPEGQGNAERLLVMVHDEYIRVARKLIETGLAPATGVQIADALRYLPEHPEVHERDGVTLEMLAALPLREPGA